MFARLLLLFTVVPAIELYLLILIGQWIGALETVLIIVVTGTIGAWLAKREGLGVIRQLQEDTLTGLPPGDRIVEGLMVLVGGALLITPGVMTDTFGFVLIMPWTRTWIAPRIKAWATRRLLSQEGSGSFMGATVTMGRPRATPRPERGREPLRPSSDGFAHPVVGDDSDQT